MVSLGLTLPEGGRPRLDFEFLSPHVEGFDRPLHPYENPLIRKTRLAELAAGKERGRQLRRSRDTVSGIVALLFYGGKQLFAGHRAADTCSVSAQFTPQSPVHATGCEAPR